MWMLHIIVNLILTDIFSTKININFTNKVLNIEINDKISLLRLKFTFFTQKFSKFMAKLTHELSPKFG
jgi:hypothetical protein